MKTILSVLFFNYDSTIRTHHCAHGTSDALAVIGTVGGEYAFLVALLMLNRNDLLRARRGAELAALTAVENDAHLCHLRLPFLSIEEFKA